MSTRFAVNLGALSNADWGGIALAFAGTVTAWFGGVTSAKRRKMLTVVSVLAFIGGVYLLILPSNDHQSDLSIQDIALPAARCTQVLVKGPEIAGKQLWVANTADDKTWVIQEANRGKLQDDGDYMWTRNMTLGPRVSKPGTFYKIVAFYVSDAETKFIHGITAKTPAAVPNPSLSVPPSALPSAASTLTSTGGERLPYWTSSSLPDGVPAKLVLVRVIRRDGVPEDECRSTPND